MIKNITFSRLESYGRLGNQLFELAALFGLAHRYKGKPIIRPDWKYRKDFHIPDKYFGKINPEIEILEDKFHYLPDFLVGIENENISICGTFQSQHYFEDIAGEIFEMLMPKGVIDLGSNSVGIHIRKTDYVNNQAYAQYTSEYYISAILKYFNNPSYKFYIVSDDIEYCRKHFIGDQYIIEKRTEVEDLAILAGCHYHIISASSFSWWGVFLSGSDRIIRPPRIFDGSLKNNYEGDFWPPRWEIHEDFKINLRDVTFIIPVKFDHQDRRENINITLNFLQKTFDTNIIVGEQAGTYFKDLEGIRYISFPYQEFHRTKMLNRMTQLANTPIIVNWDADILLSPFQIIKMVEMLRGNYDFVYPYDGRFLRVGKGTYERDPELIDKVRNGDIGNLAGYEFIGENDNSVGGAIGYKKESFIEAGMENENFIAYAPEDVERYERFNRMNYRIGRIDGPLYHLNHYCGLDSSTKNPYWKSGMEELKKEREMEDGKFFDYVGSWPWLDKRKIVLCCYADDNYKEYQDRLINMAEQSGQFDEIRIYSPDKLHYNFREKYKHILKNKKGAGYWIWKPWIICNTLLKMHKGDILVYLDSGDIFHGDLRTYLLNKSFDIILTKGAYKNSQWTKRDCFIKMECDNMKYWNAIQLEAGIIICKNDDKARKINYLWEQFCLDEEILTDSPNKLGENMLGFKEHRHDQSILTNLSIKYGIESSSEIRQFVTCNVPLKKELKGISFLIPIFYDGPIRKANLLTVIKYYSNLGIKIVLGEQLENKFKYLDGQVKYMNFPEMKEFHRTKMLNEMAKQISDDIICVCDADVIIPEEQIRLAIDMLNDRYDVVYPYTEFIKLDKITSEQMQKNTSLMPIGKSINSVGGMIFFKRESYLEAGGENENFISWGIEDKELYSRFNKLEYKIGRVPGNLYHLWHPISVNSGPVNPYLNNNRIEFKKVDAMNKEELQEYIKKLKK